MKKRKMRPGGKNLRKLAGKRIRLAVIAGTTKPAKAKKQKARVEMDDVRAFLEGAKKKVLVKLLMDRAEWDTALQDQLLLKAAMLIEKPYRQGCKYGRSVTTISQQRRKV